MNLMSVGVLTTAISASAVAKQDHGAERKRDHPHVRGGRAASWRQSDINLHAEAVPEAVREICLVYQNTVLAFNLGSLIVRFVFATRRNRL